MESPVAHNLFHRRPIIKSKTSAVKWVREWVTQHVVATGGRCTVLRWVREDTSKTLKENEKEPEVPDPEPEPTSEVLFLCSYEGCGKTSEVLFAIISFLLFCRLHSEVPYGAHIHASMPRKAAVIVRASEIDGEAAIGGEGEQPKDKESVVPVENLPLESKLQMIQEQRLKMKLAKKLRLRRKRLVRKRHLRKKGRWPPSKMKKNKNV